MTDKEAQRQLALARQRRYRETHREELRAKGRAAHKADLKGQRQRNKNYRAANLEKERARCRAYSLANPDKLRAKHLRAKYGITHQDYEQMLAAQDYGCKICGTGVWAERSGFLVIDHDHTTGCVRGLLCMACNKGLGLFRDAPALLKVATQYLENAPPGDGPVDIAMRGQ